MVFDCSEAWRVFDALPQGGGEGDEVFALDEVQDFSIRVRQFHDEKSVSLIVTADEMFGALWDHRACSQQARKKQLEQERRKLDRAIEQLLDQHRRGGQRSRDQSP